MWKRFAARLRCPLTQSRLRLEVFAEDRASAGDDDKRRAEAAGIPVDAEFSTFVESGALVADVGWVYPIYRGLPILLPYRTPIHDEFERSAPAGWLAGERRFPDGTPPVGERDVFRSFSEEWRAYRYDGVLWDVSYEDNRRRLIAEVGLPERDWRGRTWLEVGCGIGMTTAQAEELTATDAVGLDLSVAALNASLHFRGNPFLHFVQASIFALPFAPASFDLIYSRGVLHHTYSPRAAFRAMAALGTKGSLLYVWVYGPGSTSASWLRRGAYQAERSLRPVLSRLPPPVTTAVLSPLALGYLAFNAVRRRSEPGVQRYTFSRALHAARDRFTPHFAHRQSADEVAAWFREEGCEDVEVVDWRQIPAADRDDFQRNTAIRGRRP